MATDTSASSLARQARPRLDDLGDLAAEAAKDLRHLKADVPDLR